MVAVYKSESPRGGILGAVLTNRGVLFLPCSLLEVYLELNLMRWMLEVSLVVPVVGRLLLIVSLMMLPTWVQHISRRDTLRQSSSPMWMGVR